MGARKALSAGSGLFVGRAVGLRRVSEETSRKVLGWVRNGLTGYRIQYKRSAIERLFCPIGVMGIMSKRLLYPKYLAFSLGAVHLPGRACATTLACGAAISPRLQTDQRDEGVIERNSQPVSDGYVA